MFRFFTLLAVVICLTACGSSSSSPTATSTSLPPTATHTPGAVEFTATALVIEATQTGIAVATNPALAATNISVEPLSVPENCTPGEFNSFNQQLSDQIQAAIDDAGLKDTDVGVITVEQTQGCIESTVVRSQFTVNMTVGGLNDEAFLAERAALILEVLQAFPPESAPGLEPAVLSLRFDFNDEQRILETEYRTARQAFTQGLRGKDLLQALGGLRQS